MATAYGTESQTFAPYISPQHYPLNQPHISQAEALTLLLKYRATGRPEYRNAILTGNMKMIAKLCRQPEYQYHQISIDDLMQEASIGFLKGVDRYDPGKSKASISNYARHDAEGAVRKFIQQ